MFRLLCLVLALVVPNTDAVGVAQVKIALKSYRNPEGVGMNGHCCDGRWRFCQRNGCDHYFIICIDSIESTDIFSNCKHGKFESKTFKNELNNKFPDDIGVGNPIILTYSEVTQIPDSLSVKVDVWDDDSVGKDDHVDYLRSNLYLTMDNQTRDVTISSRTSLEIQVTASCSENLYGKKCERFCKSAGNVLTCDKDGNPVCLTGWTGEKCNEKEVAAEGCPSGWKKHSGHCYMMSAVERQWDSARSYCQVWDADLLQVDNSNEMMFIREWLKSSYNKKTGFELVWFGANDKKMEGRWEWADGSKIKYSNWKWREPNGHAGEDCGAMYQSSSYWNGLWNDIDCKTSSLYFICEKPLQDTEGSGDVAGSGSGSGEGSGHG